MKWFSQTADEGTGTMTSEAFQTSALDYRGNGVYRMAIGTGQVEWDIEVGFRGFGFKGFPELVGFTFLPTALQIASDASTAFALQLRCCTKTKTVLRNDIRPGQATGLECMLEEVPSFIPLDRPDQRSRFAAAFANEHRGLGKIDAICSRKARILVDASCRVSFPSRCPILRPGSCFIRRLEVSGLVKAQRNLFQSERV